MSSLINGYIGKLNPGDGTEYSLGSTAYAECATAAATTQKEIEMTGFTLMQGATIFVKFINGNTNNSPTLRIKTDTNSYTDIKNIIISNNLINNSLVNLTYDGTQWLADSSNLNSTILENSEPYSFRQTGGSANVREIDANIEKIDSIIGGTIAWNQLIQNGNFEKKENWIEYRTTYTINNNEALVTKTTDDSTGTIYQQVNVPVGHKIFVSCEAKCDTAVRVELYCQSFGDEGAAVSSVYTSSTDYTNLRIITETTTDTIRLQLRVRSANSVTGYFKNVMLIDLTAMFGSIIADYIYGLEQATPGAGVAWFRKLFPKDYYAYSPGKMESVQVSAHKTVGFNQWDEEWEVGSLINSTGLPTSDNNNIRAKNYCNAISSAVYYLLCTAVNLRIYWYDADKNFISTDITTSTTKRVTAPSNARFFKIRTTSSYGNTYHNDICINLSHSGYRNGEYEPYIEHNYPLDDSLTLRGIPKLDANDKLYFDGDIYKANGTVTRRYGIVDLGEQTWAYNADRGYFYFMLSNIRTPSITADVPDWFILSNGVYKIDSATNIYNNSTTYDKCVSVNPSSLLLISNSAYTDAQTFKAAMSGVYLVYELVTPSTETADPYTQIQKCSAYGTEEFIDTGDRDFSMPVGHITEYQNGSSFWINDGTVVGPANSTDNAIARFDGTTGKIIQNSGVTIDSSNNINTSGSITATTFNGALNGTAAAASKLTNLTSTDNASSSDTWRKIWMTYTDGTTGRPAVSTNLTFQTSTNTLKANHFLAEHISGGQNEFRVTYGSTVDMAFMVGTGNETHGLYDSKANKWMIVADGSGNVTVNGNAETASKLGTSNVGTKYKPIYLVNGVATASDHEFAGGYLKTNADLNTLYDSGFYSVPGGSATNYPIGGASYANLIVSAYRKPNGNTTTDFAWQLGNFTQSSDRMWYRTSQSNAWRDWRQIVNIATNTAVGDSKTPTYVDTNGAVQALNYTIEKSVPSNAVFTDANVTQTITSTTNAAYRLLMSVTADDTTRTEGVRKDTDLRWNPSSNTLDIAASNANGVLETSSGTLTLNAASTLWLNKGTNYSIIFTHGQADAPHEIGRFNTSGNFVVGKHSNPNSLTSYQFNVIGNSGLSGNLDITGDLDVIGNANLHNTTDAAHSTDTAAAVSVNGGVSVAKQVAAKEIKIDNGSTTKGVTMQYDATLEVLNFVFA